MNDQTFKAFYPKYLIAHGNSTNKKLHFIGATLFFCLIITAIITGYYLLTPVAILVGYILPGIGHKHYENNESFRSTKPIYCVLGATKMYFDTWKELVKRLLDKKNI